MRTQKLKYAELNNYPEHVKAHWVVVLIWNGRSSNEFGHVALKTYPNPPERNEGIYVSFWPGQAKNKKQTIDNYCAKTEGHQNSHFHIEDEDLLAEQLNPDHVIAYSELNIAAIHELYDNMEIRPWTYVNNCTTVVERLLQAGGFNGKLTHPNQRRWYWFNYGLTALGIGAVTSISLQKAIVHRDTLAHLWRLQLKPQLEAIPYYFATGGTWLGKKSISVLCYTNILPWKYLFYYFSVGTLNILALLGYGAELIYPLFLRVSDVIRYIVGLPDRKSNRLITLRTIPLFIFDIIYTSIETLLSAPIIGLWGLKENKESAQAFIDFIGSVLSGLVDLIISAWEMPPAYLGKIAGSATGLLALYSVYYGVSYGGTELAMKISQIAHLVTDRVAYSITSIIQTPAWLLASMLNDEQETRHTKDSKHASIDSQSALGNFFRDNKYTLLLAGGISAFGFFASKLEPKFSALKVLPSTPTFNPVLLTPRPYPIRPR
ncbi:MAG: hypothetical protein Tsb005_07040 [Gammaproteobacteria bacterium]